MRSFVCWVCLHDALLGLRLICMYAGISSISFVSSDFSMFTIYHSYVSIDFSIFTIYHSYVSSDFSMFTIYHSYVSIDFSMFTIYHSYVLWIMILMLSTRYSTYEMFEVLMNNSVIELTAWCIDNYGDLYVTMPHTHFYFNEVAYQRRYLKTLR